MGIDLCEIARIKHSMGNPRFFTEVLGPCESAELEARGFPPQSAAASFAAKEAFAKALGTGVRGFALYEVELLHGELGAPYLAFSGRAAALAYGKRFSVSVSHTRELATAVVLMEEA